MEPSQRAGSGSGTPKPEGFLEPQRSQGFSVRTSTVGGREALGLKSTRDAVDGVVKKCANKRGGYGVEPGSGMSRRCGVETHPVIFGMDHQVGRDLTAGNGIQDLLGKMRPIIGEREAVITPGVYGLGLVGDIAVRHEGIRHLPGGVK